MAQAHDLLVRKLREHSDLSADEADILSRLSANTRRFAPGEDIARQGDRPTVSVVVLRGMAARYHALQGGKRQYLSFHIPGDVPDAQTLFLDVLDHGLLALDEVEVAMVPHAEILGLFEQWPSIGFAIWRETLIDAAIFREAITNNAARSLKARLSHLFCEQYYRARAGAHAAPGSCSLPLTQIQLGETVGASLVSVNRTLRVLRQTKCVDLSAGMLHVRNWPMLANIGEFDPGYLHLKRPLRRL